MRFSSIVSVVALPLLALAGPTHLLRRRQTNIQGNLPAILQGLTTAVAQGDRDGVLTALGNVVRGNDGPASIEQVGTALQNIFQGTAVPPATLYEYIGSLQTLNLISTIDSLLAFVNGAADGQASTNNNNPPPPDNIYPQKLSCDAPYSLDETTLRSAIYIPASFTYGQKPPVILFPGTGNFGYETFAGNFIPLLTNSDFADPVWVNVPGRLLNDAQKNAEFAAYTINYIASITQKNVTMLAWSQGNIDAQWAYKYWPSTTQITSDHVAISADYAGTIVANFASLPGQPLPPSLLQQRYLQSSNFITTLRTCNGDSGYVPTTSIYSALLDEIVQPQAGTGASAFLNDVRGVGVTNNEVQTICRAQVAGSFYTHEGVLYNPLSYFLLRDAMANPGPGDPRRLDLASVCATYATPGLDLGDVLVTENTVAIAGLAILTYPSPVFAEPAISAYASTCPVSTCLSTTTSTSTSTSTSTTTSVSTSTSSSSVTTTTSVSTTTSSYTTTTTTATTSTRSTSTTTSGSTSSSVSSSTYTSTFPSSTSTSTSIFSRSSTKASTYNCHPVSTTTFATGSTITSSPSQYNWATWSG